MPDPMVDMLVPDREPPALSATSDAPGPSLETNTGVPPTTEAVDETPQTEDTGQTVEETGEPTGGDQEPGETEPPKQTPQQEAAWTRLRNQRKDALDKAAQAETKLGQALEALAKLGGVKEDQLADPKPDRALFTDPNAYDQALVDWSSRRATEAAKVQARTEFIQERQNAEATQLRETFKTREAAFIEEHPDYEDVWTDELPISPAVGVAIMLAEDGPAIGYWLGNNPDEAARINKMPPALQAIEIGKISARLSNPPPPPRRKPEPIVPVGARASGGEKSPDEMTMAEYAVWQKQRSKVN